jgi:hypothetical protein
MELRPSIRPFARRAAMTAALGVLLVPAAAGTASAAKKRYPTISSVRPMNVAVGETIEIRGKNFRRGKNKNTVVFKRDGARAVFVKAPVGTTKLLRLTIPAKLSEFFAIKAGAPVSTRFRLRVLSSRLGKKFTADKLSPVVGPARAASLTPEIVAASPDGDCDGDGLKNGADSDDDNDLLDDATEKSLGLDPCKPDTDEDGVPDRFEFDCDRNGVLNRDQADDDNDLLSDTFETSLGTDPCAMDSDGDGVEDGYEYRSALDLNDDEDQNPNAITPYPGRTPYPNPLFKDGDVDHDGDSLTLAEEQALWKYTYTVTLTDTRDLNSLSYTDGQKFSRSQLIPSGAHQYRHQPTLPAAGYDKHTAFVNWTIANGYRTVALQDDFPWWDHGMTRNNYGLFDVNRSGSESNAELEYFDYDGDTYLSDDERDEDSDGLTNFDETHGRMLPEYWEACYSQEKPWHINYGGTNVADADTDGDGVLDGADDQDHDDIPNLMELSRYAASGLIDWDDAKGQCNPEDQPALPTPTYHPNAFGRMNPLNPCLPAVWSRTCPSHVNSDLGAPFDGSPNWYSLN